MYLWHNGELKGWDSVSEHITVRGSFGTVSAVYEGIRAYRAIDDHEQLYLFRGPDHIRRLQNSMKFLTMSIPYSSGDILDAIHSLIRMNNHHDDVYVKPVVYFSLSETFSFFESQSCEILITAVARPSGLGTGQVLRSTVSPWRRISDSATPPRVKCIANYHNARLAMTDALRKGFDSAVLLSQDGHLAEAPVAAIGIVRDSCISFPPLSNDVLESITRETIADISSQQLGIPVSIRQIDFSELYLADEIFICGTGQEILPIVNIDGRRVGSGESGPIVRDLQRYYEAIVRGQEQTGWASEWLSGIY